MAFDTENSTIDDNNVANEQQVETNLPEKESEPKDIRQQLEKAYNEVKEKTAKEEAPQTADVKPKTVEKPSQNSDALKDDGEAQTEKTTLPAPNSWSADAKKEWEKIPDRLQKEISKREAEIHKTVTRYDDERSFGKQIKDIVNPYLPLIRSQGSTPEQTVGSLLNTAYILQTGSAEQKKTVFKQLASAYNIELEGMDSPASFVDPQIETLQQRLYRLENEREQEHTYRQQQETQTINSQIEGFASDPEHVHFPLVRGHMAALLQAGIAKDLKDAYDQAVWANPETRSTLELQRQRETQEKLRTENKAKVASARAASGSITGAPSYNSAPVSALNGLTRIEDQLAAAYAAAGSNRL